MLLGNAISTNLRCLIFKIFQGSMPPDPLAGQKFRSFAAFRHFCILLGTHSKFGLDPRLNHRSSQKQPFTPKEDEELMKGLKKHGRTNWTNILRDKTFTFSKGRTADALKKRALSKGFNLNTKIIKMKQSKFV